MGVFGVSVRPTDQVADSATKANRPVHGSGYTGLGPGHHWIEPVQPDLLGERLSEVSLDDPVSSSFFRGRVWSGQNSGGGVFSRIRSGSGGQWWSVVMQPVFMWLRSIDGRGCWQSRRDGDCRGAAEVSPRLVGR